MSNDQYKSASDVPSRLSDDPVVRLAECRGEPLTPSFDEEAERVKFEAQAPYRIDRHNCVYESQRTEDGWQGWLACAKSRAEGK